MALAAASVMKAHGRTEILIGGVDAMPPAIQAVVEGRMHATVRNSSCRIHGGAIVAGVAAARGPKTGLPIPKQDRHRRPDRHEDERARDAVDGGAVPDLTMRNQHTVRVRLSVAVTVCLIGAVATAEPEKRPIQIGAIHNLTGALGSIRRAVDGRRKAGGEAAERARWSPGTAC